jgi:hypothetical protein
MNFQSRYAPRKRADRRGDIRFETLEQRALLAAATETFNLPSLQHLIIQAREGVDTAPAAINLVLTSLASQLLSGPLANLHSGAATGDEFVTQVQGMQSSYDSAINTALLPEFPNVDTLLVLQGQRIVAEEVALNQQHSVGLISLPELESKSDTAINGLVSGPIFSLHTSLTGYATVSQAFEADLHNVADGLGASAPLTPSDASKTMLADIMAYQAVMNAGLQVTRPGLANTVDMAVASLITTADAVASETASSAEMLINTAISAFDAAILDTTGLFGPKGSVAISLATHRAAPPRTKDHRASSFFTTVSGTAASGGTATLTATLYSSNGKVVVGVPVSFTLDGAFAGVADTNTSGVATLTGVPTSDAVGTDTGGIGAFFPGNNGVQSATATGNLTVSQAATTVTNVSGTATFGGTATLTATLTSAVTGLPLAGQTITFTLDGTQLTTPETTNSQGVATLTGVTTTDSAGTHTNAVEAKFAGDSTYKASTGTGNLTVSKADTTLGSVSGSATFGGTATLTATLTSTTTNAGVANRQVTFTLNGTSVGSATTNSNGVATLTGVTNTESAGTYPTAIVASFAGDSNYNAATNATGGYTVTAASTSVTNVSGTASFGGTATLTATLTSTATSSGISGQTINFSLSGTSVGTATTNSSGVATLMNVPTSAPVGTEPNAVVATYTATTNYTGNSGTGNLVVSPANVTFSSVAGTATGGIATLTATLTSAASGAALSGLTVDFSLNGSSVGTATTDSHGVATLPNISTSEATGTYPGAVSVSYGGDSDYNAGSATGTLVVS